MNCPQLLIQCQPPLSLDHCHTDHASTLFLNILFLQLLSQQLQLTRLQLFQFNSITDSTNFHMTDNVYYDRRRHWCWVTCKLRCVSASSGSGSANGSVRCASRWARRRSKGKMPCPRSLSAERLSSPFLNGWVQHTIFGPQNKVLKVLVHGEDGFCG